MTAKDKLENFFSKFILISYKKRETVLRAEDTPQGIYYLNKGFVKQYMITGEGNELTLNIFKPGSFFPLLWAVTNIPNNYFYEALTPLEIHRAPVSEFLKLIKDDSDILHEINRRALLGLNSILNRLQYLTTGNSKQKVINTLLLLARRFGEQKNGINSININFSITQQEIANLAGLTRETVCIELKSLERAGLISQNKRKYAIKNLSAIQNESAVDIQDHLLSVT